MILTKLRNAKLIHGDCLDVLPNLPDQSIDFILADPPYGTTACVWDSIIPLEPLWAQLKRVIKPNGAIALFGSQPFTTQLIGSNLPMFKYTWVWEKEQGTMPMNAPYQPLKVHEDIVVFSHRAATYSTKGTMAYYPIKTAGKPYKSGPRLSGKMQFHSSSAGQATKDNAGDRYPRSVIAFNTERGKHPTQKPVALLEYLIETYTNAGEVVLDFTMGSGSTGVACLNTGRKFIGIELDSTFYQVALTRLSECQI